MIPFTHRAVTALALVLATMPLSGCLSIFPDRAAPDGLYRVTPDTRLDGLAADLAVREPEAARILSGREMASLSGDGALRIVGGVEWADRSTLLLQTALLDVLSGTGAGTAFDAGAAARGAYELSWRISDLYVEGGTAVCRLDLLLLDGETRAPLARERIDTRTVVANANTRRRALALSDAAADCVTDAGRALIYLIDQDRERATDDGGKTANGPTG